MSGSGHDRRAQARPSEVGLKRPIFGRPFASNEEEHQLLPRRLALPVFASDPLSSVVYATEGAMRVLAVAGAALQPYHADLDGDRGAAPHRHHLIPANEHCGNQRSLPSPRQRSGRIGRYRMTTPSENREYQCLRS